MVLCGKVDRNTSGPERMAVRGEPPRAVENPPLHFACMIAQHGGLRTAICDGYSFRESCAVKNRQSPSESVWTEKRTGADLANLTDVSLPWVSKLTKGGVTSTPVSNKSLSVQPLCLDAAPAAIKAYSCLTAIC